MDLNVGLIGGLVVAAIAIVIVFKILKSLLKAAAIGLIILVLLGAWLAYSAGLFG